MQISSPLLYLLPKKLRAKAGSDDVPVPAITTLHTPRALRTPLKSFNIAGTVIFSGSCNLTCQIVFSLSISSVVNHVNRQPVWLETQSQPCYLTFPGTTSPTWSPCAENLYPEVSWDMRFAIASLARGSEVAWFCKYFLHTTKNTQTLGSAGFRWFKSSPQITSVPGWR